MLCLTLIALLYYPLLLHLQKLVAEDEAIVQNVASAKCTTNIQSLPTRQYLDRTVVPILLQGMAAVAKERYGPQ